MEQNQFILKQLRTVLRDLYTEEGEHREQPNYSFVSKSVSKEAIYLLEGILKVAMTQNFFSRYTLYYLKEVLETKKSIADRFHVPYQTVKSAIYRDICKFINIFGDDCLVELGRNSRCDLTTYKYKLYSYNGAEKEFYSGIDLDLAKGLGAFSTYLDSSRFEYIFSLLQVYTKEYKEKILNAIEMDDLGYINYLISKVNRTELEELRYGRLMKMVGLATLDRNEVSNIYESIDKG